MAINSNLKKIELLCKVAEISNSTVKTETKLQNILKSTVRELGMDHGFIFGVDKKFNNMVLRVADEDLSHWPDKTVIRVGEGFVGKAAEDKKLVLLKNDLMPDEAVLWKEVTLRLALPVLDDTFMYGALVLIGSESVDVDSDVILLLEAICTQLAGTIRNFRLSLEAKKRISELSALFEVGKAISGNIELKKLADQIVLICAKVVNARGALLTIFDTVHREVLIKSAFGKRENHNAPPLCVALDFRNGMEGTLCVYQKFSWEDGKIVSFDDEDAKLLMTMASFLSSALEKSIVFTKMEEVLSNNKFLVQRLSTLYDISSSMMTTVNFEETLDIILEAIIVREGMEFDRALILLLDEDTNNLYVHKGVVSSRVGKSMEAVGSSGENRAEQRIELSPLVGDILTMSVPLSREGGPLAISLLKGDAINVSGKSGFSPPEHLDLYQYLGASFAVVPLMAKQKAIGVIVVDNSLRGGNVKRDQLRTLSMLAHQAGLALENSRLYSFIDGVNKELKEAKEKLIETEKMAALGEISAGMAHEIRNPLVSIGGFARRVHKQVQDDSPLKEYLNVIVDEVERLEKTLRDILDFSQESEVANFQLWNLHKTIEEAFSYLRLEFEDSNVNVVKEFSEIPLIYGDHRQIRHLFFNLFLNAKQAMKTGGTLKVRTYFYMEEKDRQCVKVEVNDTGGGIPLNILQNIFNPFFTTKAQGTGLGLSIAHRIIKRHRGDIDVENKPGEGASFIVTFPVLQHRPD